MISVHTPRLCIDARQSGIHAFLTEELIDNLISSTGEKQNSPWLEKKRIVLISNPRQVFSGQFKQCITSVKVRSRYLSKFWEKHFIQSAKPKVFHRFRNTDEILKCEADAVITTLLPNQNKRSINSGSLTGQLIVVPSSKDAESLRALGVSKDFLRIVTPSIRRFAHFEKGFTNNHKQLNSILIAFSDKRELKKILPSLKSKFPYSQVEVIPLKEKEAFEPRNWKKSLSHRDLFIYLTDREFDWPFLALESIYLNVPMVFQGSHCFLSESLSSRLTLSNFLDQNTSRDEMEKLCQQAKTKLNDLGCFKIFGTSYQYQAIYDGFYELAL